MADNLANQGIIVVELTGRMGSGKSVAARAIRSTGIDVIDADQVAKDIVQPGMPAFNEIIDLWPIVETNNGLDRNMLRELTFGAGDVDAIAELEKITHPRIKTETIKRLAASAGLYVVHERPALAKFSSIEPFYRLVIDQPDPSKEIIRVMRRARKKGQTITRGQVEPMLSRQCTREELLDMTNFLIKNDSSLDDLIEKVKKWDERFRLQLMGDSRKSLAKNS